MRVSMWARALLSGVILLSFVHSGAAQNGVVMDAGVQRAIDLQLQSIVRGIRSNIGHIHAAGAVIEDAQLRGRTIWQKVRMSYDK